MPKGSLNTKDRANTYEIFIDAGYDIQGYEPGNESDKVLSIKNDAEIIPFLTRPQSAPIELSKGLLDIAIIGEDWVKEENCPNVIKIGDLEYGKTRLVVAIPNNLPYESLSDFFLKQKYRKTPILCWTEYLNLTRQKFMENKDYKEIFGDKKPLVQIRGLVNGENNLVQIINSDGITEGYIKKGADIIVDNTQTGKTLRYEYNLKEIEQIIESNAGLYAGPTCIEWKREKAIEIFEQLYGAVIGKRYFDVKFNVPNIYVRMVREYLLEEKLCSDEPTIVQGENYTAINMLILRERFPLVLVKLKKNFKASAIVRNEVKQFVK